MCVNLGGNVTNNQAEYQGLIVGMRAALSSGIQNLQVLGDSQLIVHQVMLTCQAPHGRIVLWVKGRQKLYLAADRARENSNPHWAVFLVQSFLIVP